MTVPRRFALRVAVGAAILVPTLAVSTIWREMVYTVPVLAVLLFVAAGLPALREGASRRNLEAESAEGLDAGALDG